MAISDYLRKHGNTAASDGPGVAIRQAGAEAANKALGPLADRLATPIWADDWDVCLVLDACRLDLWREVNHTLGNGSRWSVGGASPEWISRTFADEYRDYWEETGYVTANPFSAKTGDELAVLNPDVYPLAERGLAYLDECWRDQWHLDDCPVPTVPPKVVTERAMWAWREQEMDRLVVHYMQPHIPFRSRPEWAAGWNLEGFGTGGGKADKDLWHRIRDGELDRDEVWRAYGDNLRWVLAECYRWRRLLPEDTTVLVTSDHGNAAGELGEWSHPPGTGNPAVRRVPWTTFDGLGDGLPAVDPRGEPPVVAASPEPRTRTMGERRDRLEALGYV